MDFFSQVGSFFTQIGDYIRIGLSVAFAFIVSLGQIFAPLTSNEAKFFEKWDESGKFETSYCAELKKDPDRDFVVLNLADVQLNDAELYDSSWDLAKNIIKQTIDRTKPDLITLTGDNAWGMLSYIELCKEIDSYGIPWAPVMGNHDGQNTPSEFWCAYQFTTAENCLFRFGPEGMGYGNYIINITENGKIIHTLFMMDTHSNADDNDEGKINLGADGSAGYDHLWADQLRWYEWAVNGITASAGETVESTVFMHIPTCEYSTYYAEYYDKENDCWKVEYADSCFGANHEEVCCPHGNNGFFDLCKRLGSTKNIIAGHDHVNSSSMVVDGIRLSYGLKCGSGCYWEPEMSGASTLTISSGGAGTFEHVYIRSVDAEIMNSGTYTMKATLVDGNVKTPMTFCYDNGKFSMDAKVKISTLASVDTRMVCDGERCYVVIPSLRIYFIAESLEGIGDFNADFGAYLDEQNAVYVMSGTMEINGRQYYFDEYSSKDIKSLRYYYDTEQYRLKRIETVDSEGDASIIEVSSISADVPADAFTIPSGYKDMTKEFNERGYEGIIQQNS